MATELRPSSQQSRFPRRVAATLFAGVVLCLLGFAFAVWVIRTNSNERAEADSVRLVSSSLADLQGALSDISNDYNHWNDAYDALASGNLHWLYDNYAISALNSVLFDGLVFFDGPLSTPLAWTAANPRMEPSPSFLPNEVLELVRREVARQTLGQSETYDLITVLDEQLVLLSATRTQPYDPARLEGLDPAAVPIAILVKTLDDAALADLASSLSLTDLTFTSQLVTDQSSLSVTAPEAEELGYLTWTPPRPGSDIVGTMAPILTAAALVFLTIGGLAACLAGAHARHLVLGEASAQRIAVQDLLTGLPNRRGFHQHVENILARAKRERSKRGLTVLLLDLDRFKPVNDLRGHQAGDLLLCEVARRLRWICPKDATVARLGGDEFVVVLGEQEQQDHSTEVAEQIIARISEPFDFGDWSASISCSIGIADWSEGASSSDLLRQADQAMYRAKQAGRAAYARYDETLGASLRERAALEQDLRLALERDAITSVFQPIYEVESNQLRGFEVLARWIDSDRGFVSPEVFIPLAEDVGLIDRLSELVLDQACAALAGWPTTLPISFNLSPRQFRDPGLPKRILSVLARHGIPGSRLEVEISERALMADIEVARQIIDDLTAAGVRISLDDFGTGTSSLAMLTQLPIGKIKIDRSFIAEVDRLPHKAKVVSGLLALAEFLNLDVTAEGIERAEELDFLKERNCTLGQGCFLGRPQSAESIAELLGGQPSSASVVPLFASR